MPQIANITVKKNDGTTDVIYTAVVPSAGERSPAIWRNQTVGSASAHQPEYRITSRPNGTKSARRVDVSATYPSLVTGTDGRISISDKLVLTVSAAVPLGMATTDVNEAVSQLLAVTASALIKDSFKTGFAPT